MSSHSDFIISYDLFDTLVTRKYAEPKGVFIELEKTFNIRNFCINRIKAEEIARKSSIYQEVTLDEIYFYLKSLLQITNQKLRAIKNMEIELEISCSYLIRERVEEMKKYARSNYRIILVSDTYLSKKTILAILNKHRINNYFKKLYISSELKCTKLDGSLYRLILKEENITASNMLHLGNDSYSDILIANRHGIKTNHVKIGNLNRYEKIGIHTLDGSDLNAQEITGFQRVCRVSNTHLGRKDYVINQIGVNVVGPIISSYALWIHNQAVKRGLDSLFFISRDGEILYKILMIFARLLHTGIDLHYLYGSRQAWNITGLSNSYDWVILKDPIISRRIIKNRLGLTSGRLSRMIFGEKADSLDDVLSNSECRCILKIIQSKEFQTIYKMYERKSLNITLEYLKSNKIGKEYTNIGFVDIGWAGSLYEKFRSFVYKINPTAKSTGLFFGLIGKHASNKYSYFFNVNSKSITNKKLSEVGRKTANLLEIFTGSPQKMTRCYRLKNGKIAPSFSDNNSSYKNKRFINKMRDGLLKYSEKLSITNIEYIQNNSASIKKYIMLILNEIYDKPTTLEAQIIGEYLFSSDQSESKVVEFAPKFSIFQKYLYLFSRNKRSMTAWYKGSISR